MIPLVQIPSYMKNKYKSKGEIAKRAAFMFNMIDNKPLNAVYNGKKISLKLNSHNHGYIYKHGEFSQTDSKECCYLDNFVSHSHVTEFKDMDCLITIREPERKAQNIPLPTLCTDKDGSKTLYGNYFNHRSIPFSQMVDFAQNIDENSSAKRQEFKKQIRFFEHKKEFFDKPVQLATKVALSVANGKRTSFIMDDVIMKVKKQDDVFQIHFNDVGTQFCGDGTFTLLRDENGNPLKEDENGNILNKNDINYGNPDNKLCFDIEMSLYSYNTQHSFDFKRKVDLKADKKERNSLYLRECGQFYEMESSVNATMPKYSESWLQHRFSKVYYDTFKSDLKAIKDDLISQKLDPRDIHIKIDV